MSAFPTIADAARDIATKKVSPVELAKACLDRAQRLNPTLHAFIRFTEEIALDQAKAAEARQMAGTLKGALDGIPIGHKDIYETAGVTTTAHSRVLIDHVPAEDSAVVRMWREAGVVMLGKLATHEFAWGGPSFDLPWPPARNPWDLSRDPSGSSSGSGAGVAAGLFPGAMGTDTGGSIRGPAAWCGIAGLKPTYGYVSRRGVLPLAFSLDHAGPMCWTSEDCALMMQVLAQHDPADPGSAKVAPCDFSAGIGRGVRGLRVGVVRHFFEVDVPCEPEVLAATETSIAALARLGAVVRDVTLAPYADYGVMTLISRAEAYAIHEKTLVANPELYGSLGRQRLMAGAFVRAADYVNAQRHRARLVAELAATLREVDVLVMPTSRQVAAPIDQDSFAPGSQPFFTRPFNLTGSPALSICNGFSSAGLPTSLQIVGRPFEDALVLQVGDALERELATRDRRPDFAQEMALAAG